MVWICLGGEAVVPVITRTVRSDARVGAKMLWKWNLQRHKRYGGWPGVTLLLVYMLFSGWMMMGILFLWGDRVLFLVCCCPC